MEDRVGQDLGSYRLIHLLGEGGSAEVYLGEHVYLGTMAAVKVLHAVLAKDQLENFQQEARTIASLRHPNIIRVWDFGVKDKIPFLIMDYAPNGTLRQRHPKGSQVPLEKVVLYVKQVAAALQYLHDKKLIHRDVKPGNMLIQSNDEILLSDFGIAVMAHNTYSQIRENIAGTVSYMAPEQLQGEPRPASDQYALGVIVYEWLCGIAPFEGSTIELASKHMVIAPPPLRQRVPGISAGVEMVVLTALAKDPQQRFASVKAFATALEQAYHLEQSPPFPAYNFPADLSGNAGLVAELPTIAIPYHDPNESTYRADVSPANQNQSVTLPPQKPVPSSAHTCPYCGAETRPRDNFCLNCGNRLLPASPLPQQAQPLLGESTLPAEEGWTAPSLLGSFLAPTPTFSAPAISAPNPFSISQKEQLEPANAQPISVPGVSSKSALDQFKAQFLEEADADYKAKRYKEALVAYESFLQLDTQNALVYANKANILLELGRYEEALITYNIALTLTPNDATILTAKSYVLSKLERYEEALNICDHAIQLDKENVLAYSYKGHMLLERRQYKEALDIYEHILTLTPGDTTIWVGKGNALYRLKQYKKALVSYERAIALAPNQADVWSTKGNVFLRLKRYNEALDAYEHAIALNPDNTAVWSTKGQVFTKLRHYEKALDAYEYVLEINPNNAEMWAIKGNVLSELERYSEALDAYDRALSMQPKRASIWESKGKVLSKLERYHEALYACERALAFKPNDTSLSHQCDILRELMKRPKGKSQPPKEEVQQDRGMPDYDEQFTQRTRYNQPTSVFQEEMFEQAKQAADEHYDYDVFFCHSEFDTQWVETQLANRLTDQHGFRVWLHKWELVPGESFQQALANGINQARCCAVCIGEQTPIAWFQQLLQLALNRQAKDPSFRVIPVLLPNAKNINVDDFLGLKTWVDFRGSDHAYAFYLLVCGVKGIKPGRGPLLEETTMKPGAITEEMLEELSTFKQKGLVGDAIADDYVRVVLEKVWLPQWMREKDTTNG